MSSHHLQIKEGIQCQVWWKWDSPDSMRGGKQQSSFVDTVQQVQQSIRLTSVLALKQMGEASPLSNSCFQAPLLFISSILELISRWDPSIHQCHHMSLVTPGGRHFYDEFIQPDNGCHLSRELYITWLLDMQQNLSFDLTFFLASSNECCIFLRVVSFSLL